MLLGGQGRVVEAPYRSRAAESPTLSEGSPAFDMSYALGIPPLNAVTLPAGVREIRITGNWANYSALPTPFIRLVEYEGSEAQGELFWGYRLSPSDPVSRRDGQTCVPLNEFLICVRPAEFSELPDWNRIAGELGALEAWSIAESCSCYSEPSVVRPDGAAVVAGGCSGIGDAGLLDLRRLVGEEYDTYQCDAPQVRRSNDAGNRANEIYQYFWELARAGSVE